MEFPGKAGYKITSISIVKTGSNAAAGFNLNVFTSAGVAVSDNWSVAKGSAHEFIVNGEANTAYRLTSTTNGKNFQFGDIVVTYTEI